MNLIKLLENINKAIENENIMQSEKAKEIVMDKMVENYVKTGKVTL